MNQQAFDYGAHARASDPATSHAAAARVDAKTISDCILADLRERGPATSHELAARLELSLVTVSPRMRPLVMKRLVREQGKRDGRIVWGAVA